MDSNSSPARPEGMAAAVGDKRPLENGESRDSCVLSTKKSRNGEVKEVAEILVALSAMGIMRAGGVPTAAENEMMTVARVKLAEVCESLAPKDLFPRVAIMSVMEDLGLNKWKEQRRGFVPPKMSISEKLFFAKQQMEKSQEVAMMSSQQLQINLDKQSCTPGSIQREKLSNLSYQATASESRTSIASPTILSGNVSRPSTLSKVQRQHFRLDPRPNGNLSMPKSAAWSQQSQAVSSPGSGEDNRVVIQPSARIHQTTDGAYSQNTSGTDEYVNEMHITKPQIPSNHWEICISIQDVLQSETTETTENLRWRPPSSDYMKKVLPCQVCNITINDLGSLLVCDVCEKGYHLNCLRTYNLKAIPRGEWHCFKCLSSNKGKILPQKYGRVTRSMNSLKMGSNTVLAKSSQEKKVGILTGTTAKVHSCPGKESGILNGMLKQQKIISNGNDLQCLPADGLNIGCNNFRANSNMQNVPSSDSFSFPVGTLVEKPGHSKQDLESKIRPHAEPLGNQLHTSINHQNFDKKGFSSNFGVQLGSSTRHLKVKHSEASNGTNFDSNEHTNDNFSQAELLVTSRTRSVTTDQHKSCDDSYSIKWIGDIVQGIGDNNYYQSCEINGVVYALKDYALFHSDKGKLVPSEIQAMWEDKITGLNWVTVNLCYFSTELPATVGRPCSYDVNEVYQSNHGKTISAGSIQGLCQVLPRGKFDEETKRRSRLESLEDNNLLPIYLCKWFYDEGKCVFREV